ncbi:DinB/UmuC family translesion DNA polymerase [Streptomyces sp. NPDC054901]
MPTLVRLFGDAAGRALHTHARGQDPRTVQTRPIAKSLGAERAFEHDVLDPAEHRRALLSLAEEVAARLRDQRQAAGGLALSVRYADRSPAPSAAPSPKQAPTPRRSPQRPTSCTTCSPSSAPASAASACAPRTSARPAKPPSSSPSVPATTAPWPSKRSPTAPAPATDPAPSAPPPSPPAPNAPPRKYPAR